MHIHDLLRSWGTGKRLNRAPNGYPAQTNFARFMLNPGDNNRPGERAVPLSDDLHISVDGAVSSMKLRKPLHFDVICRSYIGQQSDHEIGESIRKSRSTVRMVRESAEAWVESRLVDCMDTQAGRIDSVNDNW